MNNQIPYNYNPNMLPSTFPNQPNFEYINDNMLENLQKKVFLLEQRINNIEKKLNIQSNNIVDNYQSSMHMM